MTATSDYLNRPPRDLAAVVVQLFYAGKLTRAEVKELLRLGKAA